MVLVSNVQEEKGIFSVLTYPFFLAIIIVIICYIKSLIALKRCPREIRVDMETTIKRIYAYPFLQLLLILPSQICIPIFYGKSVHDDDYKATLIISLSQSPYFLFGFATAFLCWIQQKSSVNLTKSTMILQDLNQSEGSYLHENSQDSLDYKELP